MRRPWRVNGQVEWTRRPGTAFASRVVVTPGGGPATAGTEDGIRGGLTGSVFARVWRAWPDEIQGGGTLPAGLEAPAFAVGARFADGGECAMLPGEFARALRMPECARPLPGSTDLVVADARVEGETRFALHVVGDALDPIARAGDWLVVDFGLRPRCGDRLIAQAFDTGLWAVGDACDVRERLTLVPALGGRPRPLAQFARVGVWLHTVHCERGLDPAVRRVEGLFA